MRTIECVKCKRNLPLDYIHYYRSGRNSSGFEGICKECKGYKFTIVPDNEFKKCSKCKNVFPRTGDYFNKCSRSKDKLHTRCKTCTLNIYREYILRNEKYIRKQQKEYHEKNKEWRNKNKRLYRLKNIERLKESSRLWHKNNRDLVNKYTRNKYNTDINFKLRSNLHNRINDAIYKNVKSASTIQLIGCNIDEFKGFIELKFKEGMSWDNHGKWHIDHIKPCASFDLSKKEEQRKCFNYKNLQPLWAKENLSKGDKIL